MANSERHDREILDQFTRQANPFADNVAHSQEGVFTLIAQALSLSSEQRLLDVACGPGLLANALARHVQHVTGLDMVPAMLERARLEQQKAGRTNMHFELGDARALPYADASFDRVVTRFSFHHFEQPGEVLAQLIRVCRPGGKVAVIDVAPAEEQLAAYDEVERLRDPSHTRALSLPELERLFVAAGILKPVSTRFQLAMSLEPQLAASFPRPGDAERIRALFRADAKDGIDRMGMSAHFAGDEIRFAYPCAIVSGTRPAETLSDQSQPDV